MLHFMPHSSKKTYGFTLVEMLLVVFLIAVLATTAITSYMNSTDTFRFLQGYKQVMSTLRTARSYAVTNKWRGDDAPKHYGVCLSQDWAIVFADISKKEMIFEIDPIVFNKLSENGKIKVCGFGAVVEQPGKKYDEILLEKNFRFDDKGYLLKALDAKPAPAEITMPLWLFYASGSGDLTILDGGGVKIEKDVNKYINLEFSEKDGDAKKYIRLLQISGLAEEMDKLN